MLEDNALAALIQEFSRPRPELAGKSYLTHPREWFERPLRQIGPLLSHGHLKVLTVNETEKIYREMTVGGPKLYPKTFLRNGIPKIRVALEYLIYGRDDLHARFQNFAANSTSQFRLKGVGRSFASTALFLHDHTQYAIWNAAVDGGLELLGILPKAQPGTNLGEQYVCIVKVLKQLQSRCHFADLSVMNEFIELIFHRKIGREVLRPRSPSAPIKTIPG